MGTVAKGCFQSLLVWAIASAGLYFLTFANRFDSPANQYGALAGGLLISFAYGLILNARLALTHRKVIKASRNAVVFQDGQLVAAIGTIRALREPILTPFRRLPCVSYAYSVECERQVRSSNNTTSTTKDMLMGGFAMTPCAVKTPIADVRILAFAMPADFPEKRFSALEYRKQIDEYCVATSFGSSGGFEPGKVFAQLKNALTEDDGELREDWRTPSLESRLENYPDESKCMEQFIPDASPVCVIGTWSAAKAGLLADIAKGGLQVFPGDANAALSRLAGKIRWNVILSVAFLVAGTAGMYGILKLHEGSAGVKAKHIHTLEEAVSADNLFAAEKELRRDLDFTADATSAENMLQAVKSIEMLKLLRDHGLDLNMRHSGGRTALDNALYRGQTDRAKLLIEAGADPNVGLTEFGSSSLDIAFDTGNRELFQAIKKAGGVGTFVTAENGTPITSVEAEPIKVIQNYLTAHAAQDSATVRALTDGWPDSFFESFERGLYKETRNPVFLFDHGFMNDEAATVLVIFQGRPGAGEHWLFTLVKRGGEWKIRRESWDDKYAWATK